MVSLELSSTPRCPACHLARATTLPAGSENQKTVPALGTSPFLCNTPRLPVGSKTPTEFSGAGGAEGNRTPDLDIANVALSQLSYGPMSGVDPAQAERGG